MSLPGLGVPIVFAGGDPPEPGTFLPPLVSRGLPKSPEDRLDAIVRTTASAIQRQRPGTSTQPELGRCTR
jgi:hypothetical protein